MSASIVKKAFVAGIAQVHWAVGYNNNMCFRNRFPSVSYDTFWFGILLDESATLSFMLNSVGSGRVMCILATANHIKLLTAQANIDTQSVPKPSHRYSKHLTSWREKGWSYRSWTFWNFTVDWNYFMLFRYWSWFMFTKKKSVYWLETDR